MFLSISQKIVSTKFDKKKVAKEKLYGAKEPIKIWDVDVGNIYNSKYLIGCLCEVLRPLVLILPKMRGCVKTFKDKNNKLMSLRINDEQLLEKYGSICIKIEDLCINIKLNALPVSGYIYIYIYICMYIYIYKYIYIYVCIFLYVYI